MSQNRFFVIEGLDGSGKSTQLNLLRAYLQKNDIPFKDVHYPKLNEGYYGKLIAEFLRGEFGDIDEVHPKLVALLFAGDRHEHIQELQSWLDEGYVVIADRYINSNIAFQCAKCKDDQTKAALREWIYEFEYTHHALPKPAFSLYLNVPFTAVKKSLQNERSGDDRDYLNGKSDIHENSLDFQEKVRNEYLQLVQEQDDFHNLNCCDTDGNFLPPEIIHQKIIERLDLK